MAAAVYNKKPNTTTLPIMTHTTSANNNNTKNIGCCARVSAELRHPPYAAHEPSASSSDHTVLLHGPNTFGPRGPWMLVLKTGLMVWSASAFVEGLLGTPADFRLFYFAYLTHWTLMVALLYLVTSWFHTLQTTLLTPNNTTNTSVTVFHKLTWALFSVAAPGEIVVALGYWGLEWDGSASGFFYRNFMIHGVIVGIVLVDGLVINRIPVRITHYAVLVVYLSAYLAWTLVFELTDMDNPWAEATDDSDDRLYSALAWKDDPWATSLAAAQLLFVIVPLAFFVVYAISLYAFPCGGCGTGAHRRYVSENDTHNATASSSGGANDHRTAYVEMKTLEENVV